ncbi:beta-N-acetylhexosaminidase [Clostridium paraputrificum]|uniref:beta-N-acetylhexosaminidase n=1 Tax=Clostridium TaxID=1485 RepID=UPI003D3347E3
MLLIIVLVVLTVSVSIFVKSKYSESNTVETEEIALIPKPLNYEVGEGEFILTEDTSIYVMGNSSEETEEVYKVAEFIRDKFRPSTGFELDIIKSDDVPPGNIYLTTLGGEENKGNEGYQIVTTEEGVKLVGNKAEGLFRAVQTLRQLLPSSIEKRTLVTDVEWKIPFSTIKDSPEYGYRGLMIDVARHFFTVDEIKRQIDFASQYKINKIHMHLSNDQGWRLEIKKWPNLTIKGGSTEVGGGSGGYYTQEDFKELVRYASERYIEVIPEFDMPGHTNAALASYGFLNENGRESALYMGIDIGFSTLMCRDEKTYEFIEDIIKEVVEISPSQYIHIGGDEANSTEKSDYDYFIGRVTKLVEKYGKTPIGWDPAGTVPEISENFILQNWSDSNKWTNQKNLKKIISIAGKTYLDMKYKEGSDYGLVWAGFNPIEDAYKWDPTDYAPKDEVIGIEAPLWSETIINSKAMDYMIYPRLLGHAEIGWSTKESRIWEDYRNRLKFHAMRMKNQGIEYYSDPEIYNK